jgi:hypothetical protein
MAMYIDLQHCHNHYTKHNKKQQGWQRGWYMEVELKTMISLTRMITSILSRKQFNQNLNFEAPCCVSTVPAVTIHLCKATFAVKLKATQNQYRTKL